MSDFMTRLRKFAKIRDQAEFSSNLQFQFDLQEAGLSVGDIGHPDVLPDGDGYIWRLPLDKPECTMIEQFGKIRIEPIT